VAVMIAGIYKFQSALPARGATAKATKKEERHATDNQQLAPLFCQLLVVRPLVEDRAVGRPQIFRPLSFQMDQRPLTTALGEVLQAGELQKLLFRIRRYPMRVQVTPAGRAASSTVTV